MYLSKDDSGLARDAFKKQNVADVGSILIVVPVDLAEGLDMGHERKG